MATNHIKKLAGGVGADVLSQAEYEALPDIASGFPTGILSRRKLNKALRQSSVMAAAVAQTIVDNGNDVSDDMTPGDIAALLKTAILSGDGSVTALAADLASTAAGKGAALVGVPNRGTLLDKIKDLVHIKDFGSSDTGVSDESAAETSGLSLSTSLRSIFGSLWMWKFPRRGIKVWKSTFGIKDQAAVVSVTMGDDASEPTTEIVGFASDAAVSDYADRDHCAMFVQAIAPPTLVTTAATVFTATSVTSAAFAGVISSGKIKRGMMIDTGESPIKKTGTVVSATGSTIVVSGWYVVDGSRATGTPANGTMVYVNPSTKVWAHNANVWLNPGSHASNAVGFELGLFNFKAADLGYLYDAINLGTYRGQGAFQCRGAWVTGFYAYAGTQYGFVAQSASSIGFYTNGTTQFGFQSDGSSVAAVLAKNCGGQALLVQDVAGNNLSWIDGSGRLNRSKVFRQIFTNGQTINDFVTYAHTPVLSSATTISLPSPAGLNTDRLIYLHNPPSSTITVTFAGSVESGTGSITVAPGVTRMIVSDGTYWMG